MMSGIEAMDPINETRDWKTLVVDNIKFLANLSWRIDANKEGGLTSEYAITLAKNRRDLRRSCEDQSFNWITNTHTHSD